MKKIREGYKETEIGVIPEDWEVKSVESLSRRVCVGFVGSCNDSYTTEENGIPMIRTTNLNTDGLSLEDLKYVTREFHDKNKKSQLLSGDILVARHGSNGKACLFNNSFEANSLNVVIIRPDTQRIDNFYFKEFFNSKLVRNQVTNKIGGSVQSVINTKAIAEIKIAFPPLPEQQRIAEILSTIDEHIEKLDKTIEDYQLLKKGMMRKLLTEGIGHTEFKDTEIGRIPKYWEVKELGEIGEIVTGSTPKTAEPENYGYEYCWVSPADLGKSKYITNTNIKLSLTGFNKTRKLPRGSVLVTCIGSTIGKIGVLGEETGSTNQQINSIICNETIDSEFVYYSIKHNFDRYTPYISTQAVPIINKTVFSKFIIQCPPLQEQQLIVEILSNIDNRIELYESEKQDFIQLKKALMEKLLTGKIRTI